MQVSEEGKVTAITHLFDLSIVHQEPQHLTQTRLQQVHEIKLDILLVGLIQRMKGIALPHFIAVMPSGDR